MSSLSTEVNYDIAEKDVIEAMLNMSRFDTTNAPPPAADANSGEEFYNDDGLVTDHSDVENDDRGGDDLRDGDDENGDIRDGGDENGYLSDGDDENGVFGDGSMKINIFNSKFCDNLFKETRNDNTHKDGISLAHRLINRKGIVKFEEFCSLTSYEKFEIELRNRLLPLPLYKCITFEAGIIVLKFPNFFWSSYVIDLVKEENKDDGFNYAKNRLRNKTILQIVFGLVGTFNIIDDENILESTTQIQTHYTNDSYVSLFHVLCLCKKSYYDDHQNNVVGCLYPLVYCIYINPYPYIGSWAHFPSKILKSNPQTLKTQYGAVADKIFDSENDYSRLFYRQWDDAVAAAVIEKTQKKKGRKRKNNKGGKKTTKKLKTKDENDAAAANKKKQKEEAAAVKKLEKEAAKKKREEAAAAKKAEKEIAAELKRIQKEMAKLEKEAADAQRKLDKQANQLANKQRIRELSEQIFDAIHSNSAEFKMNSKYMIKDYYNNTVQKRLQNWEEITNKIRENPTFINYSICSIGQYIELSDMLIYVSCEKQQNIDIIMLENSNTSDANELVEYISSTNTLIDSSRLQVSNNFYKYTATTGDDNDMNINFSDDDNILIDDNLIPYINATYFIADYPTHDADNNNISTSSNEKLEKYVLFKGLFMEIYKLKDIVVARNQEDAEKIWNYFNNNNNNEQIRRTVLTFSGYVKYSNGIMRIRNHFE